MATKLPAIDLYPGEAGLLSLLVVASAYMWYGSYQYDGLAGFFPRLMSVIVLVLSVILLVRRLLPGRVQDVLESQSGAFADTESVGEAVEETVGAGTDEDEDWDAQASADEERERTSVTRKTSILGFLTGAYMLFGYLFGLLWGTPLYIVAYLRYTNYSWTRSVVVAVVVTAIVYFMMEIFNFPLESGLVFDLLGIEVPLGVAVALGTGVI